MVAAGDAFEDAEEYLAPTLDALVDASSGLRWVFVGGKGGVGKTTTACSLALRLAAVRRSVLLISTDPAHNVSDAFRQKVGRHPTKVEGVDNLFAMEVDPTPDPAEIEQAGAAGGLLTDLAGSVPGIDEAMSFAEVLKLVQSLDYETVVFDTAPTGHTLRLLHLPDALEQGLGKLLGMTQGLGGMVAQIGQMMGLPGLENVEDLMERFKEMKVTIEQVNAQFKDPALTTFVAVAIPEFLSLYETERLVQELSKYDIDCRNVVVNQVLYPGPEDKGPLLAARVAMQNKYLSQFEDLYAADFHLVRMPMLPAEVRGVDALENFSQMLTDPARAEEGEIAHQSEVDALRKRVAELEAKLADKA